MSNNYNGNIYPPGMDRQQGSLQPNQQQGVNVSFPVAPLSVPQIPNAGYNPNQSSAMYVRPQTMQWQQGMVQQHVQQLGAPPRQLYTTNQGPVPGVKPSIGRQPTPVTQPIASGKMIQQQSKPEEPPAQISKEKAENMAALQELNRFRKRKMEFKLPEKTTGLVPDSPLFTQLQDLERRLDTEIYKRRNEILEIFSASSPLSEREISMIGAARRQMRVYIFGQKSRKDGKDAWSLSIHGRPIESSEDSHPGGGGSVSQSLHVAKLFFSHCLKSLKIELEGNDPAEKEVIVWEKCKHDREHKECFQINRSGPCPRAARITFDVDHAKPVYRVPKKLEEILSLPAGLGGGVYSLAFLMGTIWTHAKRKDLMLQVGNIGKLKLDDTLKGILALAYEAEGKTYSGKDEEFVSYTAFTKRLRMILLPVESFTVEYSMDRPDPAKPLCIDIHYEAPLLAASLVTPPPSMVEARNAFQAEMEELDVDLAEVYYRYCELESQYALLQACASDPFRLFREILALHSKDPRSLPNKPDDHLEIMSQSAPYKDSWVNDAIIRYLGEASSEIQRASAKKREQDRIKREADRKRDVAVEPARPSK